MSRVAIPNTHKTQMCVLCGGVHCALEIEFLKMKNISPSVVPHGNLENIHHDHMKKKITLSKWICVKDLKSVYISYQYLLG